MSFLRPATIAAVVLSAALHAPLAADDPAHTFSR